jgi:hypothetical protein
VQVIVAVESSQLAAGRYRAAEPVVTHIEELQVRHGRDLLWDASVDHVVIHTSTSIRLLSGKTTFDRSN